MATKKRIAGSDDRPNVFRLNYLAIREILGDRNPAPEEVAHREWLKRRLDEETRKVASIPTKLA